MALKIKWTKRAQKSFDKIVEYLEDEWSINSAIKFVRLTNRFLETLENQPRLGKAEIAKKDLRSFVLSRHTTVFYRIKDDEHLIILKFFDTRQHPNKKWK